MSGAWIAAFAALCVIVVLLVLVVLGTLRRVSAVLEHAEERLRAGSLTFGGLSAGDPAPDFEARTEDGSKFTGSDLNSAPSIVLFLSGGCPPCRALAAELAQNENPDSLGAELHVVLNDPGELVDLGLPASVHVIYQAQSAVSHAFQTAGTPQAVAIADGIVVASGIANSLANLRDLAGRLGQGGEEDGGGRLQTIRARKAPLKGGRE